MLDFAGIELDRYLTPVPIVALPISRGCYWGKCTFCNISNQTTSPYRVRPTAQIVADIRALSASLATSCFDFCVDAFHPQGLAQLAGELLREGLDVRWNAEVLLDRQFTAERLRLMAESGCRHLRFGFESANPETLAAMNKRNDPEVVRRILGDCAGLDIKVSLMSIIGFPTETEEQAWRTLRFYVEQKELVSFVTLHSFNVSAGSPIMRSPELCGIELVPRPGLLQPSFDYRNGNPEGMSAERAEALVAEMEEVIRQHFPQHAEIHTVGIGGWLTFLACCRHEARFFKRPIEAGRLLLPGEEVPDGRLGLLGSFVELPFDMVGLEEAARAGTAWQVRDTPSCVLLSEGGDRLHVLPHACGTGLRRAYDGAFGEVAPPLLRTLARLSLLEVAPPALAEASRRAVLPLGAP